MKQLIHTFEGEPNTTPEGPGLIGVDLVNEEVYISRRVDNDYVWGMPLGTESGGAYLVDSGSGIAQVNALDIVGKTVIVTSGFTGTDVNINYGELPQAVGQRFQVINLSDGQLYVTGAAQVYNSAGADSFFIIRGGTVHFTVVGRDVFDTHVAITGDYAESQLESL